MSEERGLKATIRMGEAREVHAEVAISVEPPRPDLKDPKVQESMALIQTTGLPPGTVCVLNGDLLFAAPDVIGSLIAGNWSVLDTLTVVHASGYLTSFRPAGVVEGEVAEAAIRATPEEDDEGKGWG